MSSLTSSAMRSIPWTLVDGLLTLRLRGSSICITEDHPNHARILDYLKQRKFRVVEALVYRQDTLRSFDQIMESVGSSDTSNRVILADSPKVEGSLPIVYMELPETSVSDARLPTVIIDPIEDREQMMRQLYIRALQTNKDTFAYQSIEEKFPGDIKVSPTGFVFEYCAADKNWSVICQIKAVSFHLVEHSQQTD